MIQVCSSCGTRWNVRDKQRAWCPRCQGTLLPPTDQMSPPAQASGWGRPAARPGAPAQGAPPRLPPGYRWIAVRPGGAPPPRRRRRPLGPTPRYEVIPQWGLAQHDTFAPAPPKQLRRGPSPTLVRRVLLTTAVLLGVAAAVYLLRYVLLIVNRTRLLNPVLANSAEWLGILVGLVAFVGVIGCWVVLTWWLIARRAAVFAHRGMPDPRPEWTLWTGCLVPLLNLVWAPVFVIDTATIEDIYHRLRKPVLVWWVLWLLSAAVSAFAFMTSFSDSPQGIADNHVSTICAYLTALATVLALTRVHRGFESKPVERPAHRWVIVATDAGKQGRAGDQSAVPVESDGQEPAA